MTRDLSEWDFACRRLAVHDEWSQIAVYVAMDMLVIIDDISK